jgi:hypothetical protein
MSFIKEKWFLILNLLIFGGSVALYFTGVSGQSEKRVSEIKALDRSTKSLRNLARQKPTEAWNVALEKTDASLKEQKDYIYSEIVKADKLIHRYYDVANPSIVTDQAPDLGNYLVYKSNLVKKWDELLEKYTQAPESGKAGASNSSFIPRGGAGFPPGGEFFPEEFADPSFFDGGAPGGAPTAIKSEAVSEEEKKKIKHFRCMPAVIGALEPAWLRNDDVPKTEQDLLDAMKNYWISVEILRVFEVVDIDVLLSVQISPPMQTDAYKLGENMFWGYRDVTAILELESGRADRLWEEFHKSPYLFRLVGFDQKNIIDFPEGVVTDAPHVSFDTLPERQRLTINLWHFDYIQEGEVLAAESVTSSSGRGRSDSRGRRGRR